MTAENIRIERLLAAPVHQVYEAWTRPDMIKTWFNMGEDWATPTALVDLKPGGQYQLDMRTPGGRVISYRGVYTEVVAERRLCFTWPAYGMSRFLTDVSVDFAPDGRDTLITLLHAGLKDNKMQREQHDGWVACLDQLARHLPFMMQRESDPPAPG
jgi:uncharacterized protein YndB with AHSA1/START domain